MSLSSRELPDNGAAPQAAFAYGNEIYRTRTRHTTLNYTHLEPILCPIDATPGRCRLSLVMV